MNDLAFDDLARRLAGRRSLSRRSLLGALGVAGLGGMVRPAGSTAQEAAPTSAPKLDSFDFELIAHELAYDPGRIFDLVAGGIDYDPYAGLLRGSRGTLWALSGNSVDQSVLLADLMRAALLRVRFVIGRLEPEAVTSLESLSLLTEDQTQARSARQRLAPDALFLEAGLVPAPVDLDGVDLTVLDPLLRAAEMRDALTRQHVEETLSLLTGALAAASVELTLPSFQLPVLERDQHVWLQYASGAEWLDVDPSIPGARPGESFAAAEQVVEAIPSELIHRVRFRVSVESASGENLVPGDVLVHEAASADLVGRSIAFLHAEPTDLEGTGLAIVQAISGAVTYYPCLTIGNDVIVDQPIVIGSGGGALDAFGDSSIDGDTIAEWLSVEVVSPGRDPAIATRLIFDRVDPVQRMGGAVDLSSIPQVDLLDVPGVGAVFAPTLELITFSVAAAPTPVDHLIQGPDRQDPISLIASLAQAFPLLHDDLSASLSGELGYRSFPDAPNVTAIVGRLDRPTDPDSTMSVLTDMLHRSVASLPLADREASVHPGVVAGALAHAAERVLTDPAALGELARGAGLDQRIGPSVGAIFAEAARQSIPTRTLLPVVGTMTLRTLDASERAKQGMRTALEAGYVVVVPERPVDVGEGPMTGWWLIDPRTGFTVDQLEMGGSATLLEYAERIATYVYGPLQKFRTLGCAVTFAAMAAAIVSAVGATVQLKEAQNSGGAVTGAFISFAGNLGAGTAGLLAPIAGCN